MVQKRGNGHRSTEGLVRKKKRISGRRKGQEKVIEDEYDKNIYTYVNVIMRAREMAQLVKGLSPKAS